jgi:hypothetical protein
LALQGPLAVRPDGQAIAALEPRNQVGANANIGTSDRVVIGEVGLIPTDPSIPAQHVWSAPSPSEELVDVTWAPDGSHLLVVGRQPVNGGSARTVMRLLDVGTGPAISGGLAR